MVSVGTPILKTEIKLVKLVRILTDQKFKRVKTNMNKKTTINPAVVMVPFFKNWWVQFAHDHGHELIYWTAATASIGINVINEIQLAHEEINPRSGPWEYCAYRLIPPASGNIAPSST